MAKLELKKIKAGHYLIESFDVQKQKHDWVGFYEPENVTVSAPTLHEIKDLIHYFWFGD